MRGYWMLDAVIGCFVAAGAFPQFSSAEGSRLLEASNLVVLFIPAERAPDTLTACEAADPRKDIASFANKLREQFSEVKEEYAESVEEYIDDYAEFAGGLLKALAEAVQNGEGLLVLAS